eukprot:g81573.t1
MVTIEQFQKARNLCVVSVTAEQRQQMYARQAGKPKSQQRQKSAEKAVEVRRQPKSVRRQPKSEDSRSQSEDSRSQKAVETALHCPSEIRQLCSVHRKSDSFALSIGNQTALHCQSETRQLVRRPNEGTSPQVDSCNNKVRELDTPVVLTRSQILIGIETRQLVRRPNEGTSPQVDSYSNRSRRARCTETRKLDCHTPVVSETLIGIAVKLQVSYLTIISVSVRGVDSKLQVSYLTIISVSVRGVDSELQDLTRVGAERNQHAAMGKISACGAYPHKLKAFKSQSIVGRRVFQISVWLVAV